MHNVNLTTLQMLTILATLDDVRATYFEKAQIADRKGDESHAKNHYDTANRYEATILSLQVQMKGEAGRNRNRRGSSMTHARQCSECGKGMNEGYLIQGASECYCSDYCLHKNVTPEEFQEFYIGNKDEDDDVGDIEIFWTEWETEEEAA